jgi:hypothetical protein
MKVRTVAWPMSLIAVTGALTGCGSSPQRSDVKDVAVRFVTAVQAKQGNAACALLTSDARQSATGATDVTCADAVLNVDEHGVNVHGAQVWGDEAQVKLGTDVVFLRRFTAGWQVRAAGCRPQPGAAYDCDVAG